MPGNLLTRAALYMRVAVRAAQRPPREAALRYVLVQAQHSSHGPIAATCKLALEHTGVKASGPWHMCQHKLPAQPCTPPFWRGAGALGGLPLRGTAGGLLMCGAGAAGAFGGLQDASWQHLREEHTAASAQAAEVEPLELRQQKHQHKLPAQPFGPPFLSGAGALGGLPVCGAAGAFGALPGFRGSAQAASTFMCGCRWLGWVAGVWSSWSSRCFWWFARLQGRGRVLCLVECGCPCANDLACLRLYRLVLCGWLGLGRCRRRRGSLC